MVAQKRRSMTLEESAECTRLNYAWLKFRSKQAKAGIRYTQAWLANQCGWSSQSAVSQFLNGRTPLSLNALLSICRAIQSKPHEISPRLFIDENAKLRPPPSVGVSIEAHVAIVDAWICIEIATANLGLTSAKDFTEAFQRLEQEQEAFSRVLLSISPGAPVGSPLGQANPKGVVPDRSGSGGVIEGAVAMIEPK